MPSLTLFYIPTVKKLYHKNIIKTATALCHDGSLSFYRPHCSFLLCPEHPGQPQPQPLFPAFASFIFLYTMAATAPPTARIITKSVIRLYLSFRHRRQTLCICKSLTLCRKYFSAWLCPPIFTHKPFYAVSDIIRFFRLIIPLFYSLVNDFEIHFHFIFLCFSD